MADWAADKILARLQDILDEGYAIEVGEGYDREVDVRFTVAEGFAAWRARCSVFLHDFLGDHIYTTEITSVLGAVNGLDDALGMLEALKKDLQAGYLTTMRELIHADLFGDFLEMAEHLLREGYQDPAAVLVGGVLEQHLRQLCTKHLVPVEIDNGNGPRPKKADQMNSDLARQRCYSGLEQKQVTFWLDLRNKAAHGKYGEYSTEQVSLMLQGVQGFVARFPA